jgi:twitching motility protein PilI
LSKRTSLKDFQESLAVRLKAAAGEAAPSARISFEASGSYWLLRLEGSGEVLPPPAISPVPLTRHWFLGVASVRGMLYGVTDFAAFLGREPTARGAENRILLIGQAHGVNAALLVSRLTGLRNVQKYAPVDVAGEGTAWTDAAWRDVDGRVWRELDAARLVADRAFLEVAAAALH